MFGHATRTNFMYMCYELSLSL